MIYYVGGYRKEIVMGNLDIAFPEKSIAEKKKIAKQFYRNLTDNFIETIKLLTISKKQFFNRLKMDLTECNLLAAKGKNLLFCTGHQMNWEYGNRFMSENMPVTWIGIYMKIKNSAVEKLFYKLRAKEGTVLIAAQEFGSRSHTVLKSQYSLGLIADQSAGMPSQAYWLYFFTKAAPFITGPDTWAIRKNPAVIFVKQVKIKRGYYELVPKLITENGSSLQKSELTVLYRDHLENSIREHPDNYLWSHRRWKWPYSSEYKKRWIDRVPAPGQ